MATPVITSTVAVWSWASVPSRRYFEMTVSQGHRSLTHSSYATDPNVAEAEAIAEFNRVFTPPPAAE